MEQRALKSLNNCLNSNIYSLLETSGGQSSNLYSNVGSFFQHHCRLDICGSLRQSFPLIGVEDTLFYCATILPISLPRNSISGNTTSIEMSFE